MSIWAKSLELGHRFLAGPLLLGVHVVIAVAQRLVGQVVKVLEEVEQVVELVEVALNEVGLQEVELQVGIVYVVWIVGQVVLPLVPSHCRRVLAMPWADSAQWAGHHP